MKKILPLFLLFAGLSMFVRAQTEGTGVSKPFFINVGPEVGFPIGNNVITYSLIFGVTIQGEYDFIEKLGVTVNTGYLSYSYKTQKNKGSQGFVPLLAGLKFYISNRAFLNLQAGAVFGSSNTTVDNVTIKSGTFFAYSPGIGHKFGSRMEGEFKFFGISNNHNHINSVGLRLAYLIKK